MDLYRIVRPLLFQLEPEMAHAVALRAAKLSERIGMICLLSEQIEHPVEVMGIRFRSPVGLAAGFDKNGDYIDILAELGFGFLEVGTVTPRPQPGNPRPRLFRLPEAEALVNRFGFNNRGVDALVANVRRSKRRVKIGVNIGANKDTQPQRRVDDYLHCLEKVYEIADYIVVNVSSPNTPGLRDLQQIEQLGPLLQSLRRRWLQLRDRHVHDVPLMLKIAPDLADVDLRSVAGLLLENDFSGVIASNTTISRSTVEHLPGASEVGGLSGPPLLPRSLEVVKILQESLDGVVPIIGCGGISNGADVRKYREAGACAVQIYTSFIYRGPAVIAECIRAWGE